MNSKLGVFRKLPLLISVAMVLAVMGCSSAQKKEKEKVDDGGGVPTAPAADENTPLGDSDSSKAMGLQTVHFPYDSFILDEQAKSVLASNASIMKEKTSLRIQIEGHCDQRGGIQYNIALGEKRANVAKRYLEDLGIVSDRITIISFGKEKPIDLGTSEEAYAKNRRDNFVITSH
jgi:peptidoglycan-associated lipoprotein